MQGQEGKNKALQGLELDYYKQTLPIYDYENKGSEEFSGRQAKYGKEPFFRTFSADYK